MTKQLSDGFKRSFYWNNYQTIPAEVIDHETNIYILISSSFQGVNYRLVEVYLSKQKALDADPRAIEQKVFQGKDVQKLGLHTILKKSKETVLEFYKGTRKLSREYLNVSAQ